MNAGQPEVDIGEAAAGVMPCLGDPNSAWGVAGQEEVGPPVIIVVAPGNRSTDHPRQRDIEAAESRSRVTPYFGCLADSCLASQQNV